MKYNPEIHHRRSIRLKEYDYSSEGAYFVTICAYKKEMYFNDRQSAEIIQQGWNTLPDRYPTVRIDGFVIMQNHVHGIILIASDAPNEVGAIHELPLRRDRKDRRLMTLSKVVGYFKMNTSKQINKILQRPGCPIWQRNYYEHVIRNEDELTRVRQYIHDNPLNWETDEENPNRRRGDS